MSLLWAIPALVAVAGFVVLYLGLRAVDGAADDLRHQLQRLGEVHLAVVELRNDATATRSRVGHLRHP
jgi:hypothetical protein